ncbi:MAG: DNA-directed RNA polymerase subunit beta' [bacterium]|nr:DNA-directed RNA polymerase subunit beta' [bacterium]
MQKRKDVIPQNFDAVAMRLASPERILEWSFGEITKPETINYRTQRPEKNGLFDERVFGPEKDYECYCGKYRGIRFRGIVCEKCGVELTRAVVRRERMGHIDLATPVSHIWFLRGIPSRIALLLGLSSAEVEKIVYFAGYIITQVTETERTRLLKDLEAEFQQKTKSAAANPEEKTRLKDLATKAKKDIESIKEGAVLDEAAYHLFAVKYGALFRAAIGAEALYNILKRIDLDTFVKKAREKYEKSGAADRDKLRKQLALGEALRRAGVRPEWMFLTRLPIVPPALRPMVALEGGRHASSDLNDLYRRVINRNNRLKRLLSIHAPEVILRNEKRILQEAVDALLDNSMRRGAGVLGILGGRRRALKSLADYLKGKHGYLRQNLLGKRVDYSGRSVIVVGPGLKLHQCGLPKRMALELFKPFVINKILEKELAYNVRGATRLIEGETDEIWAILEEVVQNRLVLLNRAPTLHRLGIQAFYPLLIEGEAIQLHPLVCAAFNADFDGDQMAVHLPLSDEAQKEARELMLSSSNILKPATGTPVVGPRQDMVLGTYYLTGIDDGKEKAVKSFSSPAEAFLAVEQGSVSFREMAKIRVRGELMETTPGRVLFNECLPDDYPFVNDQVNAKKLERFVGNIVENYESAVVEETLDRIKALGFEYATKSGVSWGIDDLIVPAEKAGLIKKAEQEIEIIDEHWKRGLLSNEERVAKVIEIWQGVKSAIEKLVPKTLPVKGSVFSIIDSGSRGSWSQPVQMAGMKGLVINPAGRIIELPVKASFKEGFNVLEYFISTHGARKGTADTALRTSTAGYLTRRLVDVSHDVIIAFEDCKDTKGLVISKKDASELGQNFALKAAGRKSLEDVKGYVKKGDFISWKKAYEIADDEEVKEIRVRSPLSCNTMRGMCQHCYGWDLGSNSLVSMGSAVGIVAAQSIGEPGTQLTMRTFHTGGVAGAGDITQGLPRVEEIFEGRVPGGKAVLSEVDGFVKTITAEGVITIQAEKAEKVKKAKSGTEEEKEVFEYEVPQKRALWVKVGDKVMKGQQLCEGNLDLKELFKATGIDETQKYVVKEIQRIYTSQGASIHDKHIEVITRQMFSRVRIKDRGAGSFSEGETVERSSFLEENAALKKAGKDVATATQILLGISKVALTTDSFLSAASFQETSRILIRASLEGKVDSLKGLKENVIIGKLIPAGTGFQLKK